LCIAAKVELSSCLAKVPPPFPPKTATALSQRIHDSMDPIAQTMGETAIWETERK
jgi:hypothetical protein